jgi:acetolactate synthase-1/2/3 large subunit
VTIVNNHSGFAQNLTGVHRIAGQRRDRGEALIRFGPADFSAVTRSFGVCSIRVEQPGEIAAALQQAIAANRPVVGDVVTALEPRAPAPWAPAR